MEPETAMVDPDTSIGVETETAMDNPDGQMNTSSQNLSNFLAFTKQLHNKMKDVMCLVVFNFFFRLN